MFIASYLGVHHVEYRQALESQAASKPASLQGSIVKCAFLYRQGKKFPGLVNRVLGCNLYTGRMERAHKHTCDSKAPGHQSLPGLPH